MCSLTCHQRVLSHIWRSSTPQSFIKISANNSCLKELPLIEDIKMPLNTLRKETSKYLYQVKVSGRSTRLASSLFIPTAWTRAAYLSILIATTCAWKTKISSYYLKLTNKNILLHLPATKTNFKTEQFSQNYAFSTRRQYYSVNNATYIETFIGKSTFFGELVIGEQVTLVTKFTELDTHVWAQIGEARVVKNWKTFNLVLKCFNCFLVLVKQLVKKMVLSHG